MNSSAHEQLCSHTYTHACTHTHTDVCALAHACRFACTNLHSNTEMHVTHAQLRHAPVRAHAQVRPLKNMMEYAGIDAVRLGAMEERLKKDVLAEVSGCGCCACAWRCTVCLLHAYSPILFVPLLLGNTALLTSFRAMSTHLFQPCEPSLCVKLPAGSSVLPTLVCLHPRRRSGMAATSWWRTSPLSAATLGSCMTREMVGALQCTAATLLLAYHHPVPVDEATTMHANTPRQVKASGLLLQASHPSNAVRTASSRCLLTCRWEEIDHPDAVQTPAEVYSSLAHQGFAVKYVRVPVTDGTAPSVSGRALWRVPWVLQHHGPHGMGAHRSCLRALLMHSS